MSIQEILSVIGPAIGVIGPAIGAIVTAVFAWHTNKKGQQIERSRVELDKVRVQQETVRNSDIKEQGIIDSYKPLAETYVSAIKALRGDMEAMYSRQKEQNERIGILEQSQVENVKEIQRLSYKSRLELNQLKRLCIAEVEMLVRKALEIYKLGADVEDKLQALARPAIYKIDTFESEQETTILTLTQTSSSSVGTTIITPPAKDLV